MALVVADNRQNPLTPSGLQYGFTLIELMVTVAVLAIVLTVAVPSFASLVNSNRLNAQANQLLAAIEYAKTEAVKNNTVITFCHSDDGSTCSAAGTAGWQGWLIGVAANPTGIEAGSTMRAGTLESAQLVIRGSETLTNAGDQIRITPQGLLRTDARLPLQATLRVCHPTSSINPNSRNVRIRSGGQLAVIGEQNDGCPAP
ncbi:MULTISPECIES: GspH/FimT family pseudopilin [unclassified Arsukibacterium]|uniref:GspH/FimT family pseudopilin n=1 Tax=unclassified Arsukibacterium TaxID=2635278 RepID=UPI0025C22E20|nr:MULTISPECIES: GspH/FimT family pseudopilin [unclassified Arsukibacterium]|tara:strand:+ start:29776 stop:30378 length:603 start_codon:yes stop_codon:yes gene_type:complete